MAEAPTIPPCDAVCRPVLEKVANKAMQTLNADLPGTILVTTTEPEVSLPEFAPQRWKCPHGATWWTSPDFDLVAALNRMNEQGGPDRG